MLLDNSIVTAHNYGMQKTKHRTSFALDDATAERLQRLARRWNVSQAEVVRRAVKLAADKTAAEGGAVAEQLFEYRKSNRITRTAADAYLKKVAEDRADWGRIR